VHPPDHVATLANNTTTGGYTLTQNDSSKYEFSPGTASGQLTQITDPTGHVLTIDSSLLSTTNKISIYDDAVPAHTITLTTSATAAPYVITKAEIPNPLGGTYAWTYTYDTTKTYLQSACDARGTTGFCKTYTWDGSNRLWKIYDRKGQLDLQFGYSTYGTRITSITDALSNVTTFSYAQSGIAPYDLQITMTDARTNVWRQDYSTMGVFIREYVPGVTNPWSYEYDPLTKMRTKSTDPNGNSSIIAYTADLQSDVETSGAGTKTYKVHDDVGNIWKVCDGRSVDANNNRVPDADTYCTIYDYGSTPTDRAMGLLRSKTAYGLAPETFTYTGSGDSLAYGSTTAYAPSGLLKTHSEPSGKVTSYEYDTAGDLMHVSDNTGPGTGTTRYEAESASTNYNYSNASTTPAWSGTGFERDGNWSGSSIVWTVSVPTAGTYAMTVRNFAAYASATNRQMSINGGTSTTISFPATSWAVWTDTTVNVALNAGSNTIGLTYDSSTGSADAFFDYLELSRTGKDVRYTYDSIGRVLSQTEVSDTFPAGVVTNFTYDAVNNKLTETQPSVTNPVTTVAHQQKTAWTYDANSNNTITAVSDVVGGDATRTTTVDYDTVDRAWQSTDAEGNVSQRVFDAVGNVLYARDGESRWVKTTYSAGNLATQVDMLGVSATTPTGTTPSVRTLSKTEYDNGGRKTASVDARNQRVEYTYDAGDRLTQTIMKNYRDDLPAGSARDALVSRVDTFDAADHPTSVSDGGVPGGSPLRSTSFTYDNQGRKITSVISSVGLTSTTTYDDTSRVTKTVTTRTGVATGGVSTAETRTTFDAASRVLTSTVENGATDLVTANTYDTRGVAKTSQTPGGSTTTFTSDQLGRIVTATAPIVNVETNGGSSSPASPAKTTGYNTFGNATQVRDELSSVTTTTYNKLGRATAITYPSYTPPTGGSAIVPSESFTYDHVGNQKSHTDRRGYTTDYTYDIYNHATVQLDPSVGGASRGQITNSYDENGNVTSTTDQMGAVTNYTYDSMNRPRTQTHVVATQTVNTVSVPGGTYTTTVLHDDLGRTVKTTTPAGVITSTTVDALGEATVVKNTANATTATASYDAVGNTVIAGDAAGRETRTVYDLAGRATSVGRFANSAASTPVTSTSATYDANNNVTAVVDGNGHTTTAAFDSLNRLTSMTSPVASGTNITTSYGYDTAGNLTRVRDGRALNPSPFYADTFDGSNGSNWSSLRWTAAGAAASWVDIQSNAGRLRAGNVASSWAHATDDATTPRNGGSTHQDAELSATLNAPTSIGSGLTTRFIMRGSGTWNGNTNQTNGYVLVINQAANTIALKKNVSSGAEAALTTGGTSTSCSCNSTTTTYKVRFQTVGTTVRAKIWNSTGSEPGSWTVTGTDSSLTSGTVAISVATDATNAANRDVIIDNLAVTPATSGATLTAYDTVYTYNSWGLPQTVVEAAAGAQTNANQRTFTREYNAGGLPTKDISPDGTSTGIVVTAAFDELGRTTTETATGLTKTYGYDKASRKTSISLAGAATETFTYDDRGLMIGAHASTGTTSDMVAIYNGDNQLTSRADPSGTSTSHYNNLGQADQVRDASTTTMLNLAYAPDYQVSRIDYGTPGSSTPYRTYTYDSIGRKASDVMKVGATTKYDASYTYDGNNNVLTENVKNLYGASSTDELYTYTYDWSNRLTQDQRKIGTGTAVVTNDTYDDAGNRLTNGTKSWTYDQRGRITTASIDGNYTWDPRGTLDKTVTAANTVDYTFDAMGRMSGYNGSGNNVTYTYDALDRIGDRTNTTTAQTTSFVYSGASTKPAATTLSGTKKSYSRDQNGNVIGVNNGTVARLAGTNNHTDIRFLFDTTGAVTDTKTYDPTGNVLASSGSTGSDLGYQSEYTDPTSNQVWMAARWYNPASAVFQSRDTYNGATTNPISLNRYTYGHDNTINLGDPSGHSPVCTATVDYTCTTWGCDGLFEKSVGENACAPWDDGDWQGLCQHGGYKGFDSNTRECTNCGMLQAYENFGCRDWNNGDLDKMCQNRNGQRFDSGSGGCINDCGLFRAYVPGEFRCRDFSVDELSGVCRLGNSTSYWDPAGSQCVSVASGNCGAGYEYDPSGACVPIQTDPTCSARYHYNESSRVCEADKGTTTSADPTPRSSAEDAAKGKYGNLNSSLCKGNPAGSSGVEKPLACQYASQLLAEGGTADQADWAFNNFVTLERAAHGPLMDGVAQLLGFFSKIANYVEIGCGAVAVGALILVQPEVAAPAAACASAAVGVQLYAGVLSIGIASTTSCPGETYKNGAITFGSAVISSLTGDHVNVSGLTTTGTYYGSEKLTGVGVSC
jgi:RHS repeat-associated protein